MTYSRTSSLRKTVKGKNLTAALDALEKMLVASVLFARTRSSVLLHKQWHLALGARQLSDDTFARMNIYKDAEKAPKEMVRREMSHGFVHAPARKILDFGMKQMLVLAETFFVGFLY